MAYLCSSAACTIVAILWLDAAMDDYTDSFSGLYIKMMVKCEVLNTHKIGDNCTNADHEQ